jgi:hypothetical protein
MGLLTCTPLITLPIARLVQREIPPPGTPAQLAEVLLSGLLVLVDKQEGLVYGFATPELRERLMALVTLRQARQVYDLVERAIAASLGCSVDGFKTLLRTPAAANQHPRAALLENYARISTRVLRRLGGKWAAFAEQVEAAWQERPADGLLPSSEEVFHFSVARLQWVELLPPLPGQRRKGPQVRGFLEPLQPALDLQLVEIPAGSFLMGSPANEEGRSDTEGPQHEVQLESFFLGRTAITQAQWREVAGWVAGPGERWGLDLSQRLEPSRFKGEERPVEGVSWFEAMEFCSRLRQRSGKTYTLPSEAQWEYACRAGTTTPFHVGDTLSAELANYGARKQTTEVGSFPANAWG